MTECILLRVAERPECTDPQKAECLAHSKSSIKDSYCNTLRQGPRPPGAISYNHSQQVPELTALMGTEVFKISSLKVIKF